MSDQKIEIRNVENLLGTETNTDDSPVQEVVADGDKVATIRNVETLLGTKKNSDGTPIKEVTPEP